MLLDTPVVEINGATYVPLRFVADSLGAQATYDAKGARVEVTSALVGRTGGLERTANGITQIVGNLTAIDLNSVPESITVSASDGTRTIAITSDAKITVQDVVTRTSTPASLADLRPGDAVSVLLRNDGGVNEVVGRYASRVGPIAAVSGNAFVLQNGAVVSPDRTTIVTLNGQPAAISDLKVGDVVTVRTNPDTQEKRQIIVSRPVPPTPQASPGAVAISKLTLSTRGALREGESFTVTLDGTPGGKATFDIGTYVTGLPMTESPAGVYTGKYTVPQGVNFARTSIYGHLNVGGQDAPRAEAAQNVAITTAKPLIVDVAPSGITVNNNKPAIYATYRSPTDVGINASSVRLEVNGLDVTAAYAG